MKPILANNASMSSYSLESQQNTTTSIKQYNGDIPIIAINDIANDKSIICRQVREITGTKYFIDYIRRKISLIDEMHLNLINEYSFGFDTTKVMLSGESILKDKINLSYNCAVVSSALFDRFTDPKNPAFLGEDFHIKLVGTDKALSCIIFKDSKNPAKNQEINLVYHCYLIIEHDLFDTEIIVDPTVSNYRRDQNMFIGSTIDLLHSLLVTKNNITK